MAGERREPMGRARHEIAAVAALVWRELLRFSRDRSQLLGAIGRPAIWMVLFGNGLRGSVQSSLGTGIDYRQFAYTGGIAMTVLFGGMFQGVTVVWDREFGMLREVLVAPISRASIVVGKTSAGATVTLVQAMIAALFAPLVAVSLSPLEALSLCGATLLLSFGVTGLGVAIGSSLKTFEGFGVISNFVVLPLYFLSGGVFPAAGLPVWMRVLVLANPVSYGVDLMRAAIGQPHGFEVPLDLAVLVSFACVTCVTAWLLFRRGARG